MPNKLIWLTDELASLKQQGLYNNIRTIGSAQGAWIVVDGVRVLNFCSNNYLGLANDARLRDAAKRAIDTFGAGPAAVRTIAGTLTIHRELEQRLATFKGAAATIAFQSGFASNLGTIAALVGKEDVIFSDELNHASIIDGARLSGAKVVRYTHGDAESLEDAIIKEGKGESGTRPYRRALIISDGVFSMDGDIAPLPALVQVSERHDIMLMIDDAHGEGVLGRGGRGIVDHFGMHGRVDIEVGTLSKAFGVVGGYVAGNREFIEWLNQRGRPFLFSSALTAADTAACIAGVDILESSTELVDKLWDNARYFKSELQNLRFDIGKSETPITPVMLGEAALAQKFSRALFENDLFAMAIGYPTVPQGKARIRVMISAAHTREDLDHGLEAFAKVGRELGVV